MKMIQRRICNFLSLKYSNDKYIMMKQYTGLEQQSIQQVEQQSIQQYNLAVKSKGWMSGSNQVVIGLMDAAYFVNRHELLKWINQTLKLEVTHIEDLGSGAIYCQLLDAAFRSVNMSKVNWKAKFQYEFIANLKIFQQALAKLGVSKKIDIEKLAKAKYQDNLELIQWLKKYLEVTSTFDPTYDPQSRRNYSNVPSQLNKKYIESSSKFFSGMQKKVIGTVEQFAGKSAKLKNNSENKENDVPAKNEKLQRIKLILQSAQCSENKLKTIQEIVFSQKVLREQVNTHILPEKMIAEEEAF